MKAYVKTQLDQIMRETSTQITCLGDQLSSPGMSSIATTVEIVGQWESAEKARLSCLVFFDELVKSVIIFSVV